LDRLLTEGKKLSPKNFIRTRVDVDSLIVEAHAKTSDGWVDLGLKCDIPLTICDVVTSTPVPTSSEPMNVS
jgi:hypothetical protein